MMRDALSLEYLADAADALLVNDSSGRVRYMNGAAAGLLECDPTLAVGRRCWTVVHATTEDGAPLCSPNCAAQRSLRAGAPCARQRAWRRRADGSSLALDLFTVHVRASPTTGMGVIHIAVPAGEPEPARRAGAEAAAPGDEIARRLASLSAREREVLQALAEGRATTTVAAHLFISPATVRNHVRSILRKLEVHSRLDAVLTFTSRLRPAAPPAGALPS
jgi:DNA-binding CsgD family transcriptional regulator